jgi:hypothetical protein
MLREICAGRWAGLSVNRRAGFSFLHGTMLREICDGRWAAVVRE